LNSSLNLNFLPSQSCKRRVTIELLIEVFPWHNFLYFSISSLSRSTPLCFFLDCAVLVFLTFLTLGLLPLPGVIGWYTGGAAPGEIVISGLNYSIAALFGSRSKP
jgi:hypothetical protein